MMQEKKSLTIAAYRIQKLSIYDIQQVFQGIMTAVERFGYEPERYGEHFRPWHAATYNNFVKITLWLGEEVRSSIRGECGHT
jgi:hypothetical protein